jgi:hypothetical protein
MTERSSFRYVPLDVNEYGRPIVFLLIGTGTDPSAEDYIWVEGVWDCKADCERYVRDNPPEDGTFEIIEERLILRRGEN